jgi:hypothetical protein
MKVGEVIRGLEKLDAVPAITHHRMYRVYCQGGHFDGLTRVSHKPASTDLGPTLVGAMAIQLNTSRRLWTDIVGWTRRRADYLAATAHDTCV